MIPRRDVIEGLFKTGVAAIGTRVLGKTLSPAPGFGSVSVHALPSISLEHWILTVMEVNYPAGSSSSPYCDSSFVVGYVLQGEIRLQGKDKMETLYRAGQIFYEPQDSVHQISANASTQHPARLLSLRFTKRTCTNPSPA